MEGFDDETLAKIAGVCAVGLVATLLGVTQLVLHRGEHAWVVAVTWGALALAFAATAAGLLSESTSDGTWQTAGSLWIVGVMGWLLLPVLQRFTAAGAASTGLRVLAAMDGVELVATRSGGLDVKLQPGERLGLRKQL